MERIVVSSLYPLPVIHLNNPDATAYFVRRTIVPHDPSHIHQLVRGDTSGKVDKVEQVADAARLPDHLLVGLLEIDPRSAHRDGEFGAGERGRGGCGFWRRNNVEDVWNVGDLEPENLIFGFGVVRQDQELHRIDLCRTGSVYASRNVVTEAKKWTNLCRKDPKLGTS